MKKTTLLLSICLMSGLALFIEVGAASSQPLALNSVEPDDGAPGEDVTLRGRGFDRPAKAYFAWGFDAERGFVLNITGKSSPTRLDAVVGEIHADVTGPVVLWEGRRSPVKNFKIGNGRFTVREAFVFKPAKTARGPSFTATAGSTPGFAGRLVNGEIHIDLSTPSAVPAASLLQDGEPSASQAPLDEISVEVSGESCGEEPPNSGLKAGFGITFQIKCVQEPCRGNLANLLVTAVKGMEGSGLDATRVGGSTAVLSSDLPLCGGAANVTTSPAPARGGSVPHQGGEALASSPDPSSTASSR